MQSVAVVGASVLDAEIERNAGMVGRACARQGLRLLVGNWPGVDDIASDAYEEHGGRDLARFDNYARRRTEPRGRPLAPVPEASRRAPYCWEMLMQADVCVVVGGLAGSRPSADAFMRRLGRPVLPLPVGGDSVELFLEIACDWRRHPMDSVPRQLFLELLTRDEVERSFSRALRATLARTPSVFLSYKHAESGFVAGRLDDALSAAFGRACVFWDRESIAAGGAIGRIPHTAASARVLLALLGRDWAAQIADPDDWVRREVAAARTAGARVIPVCVGDAPRPDERTGTVFGADQPLAASLSLDHWDADVERLVRAVEGCLDQPPA